MAIKKTIMTLSKCCAALSLIVASVCVANTQKTQLSITGNTHQLTTFTSPVGEEYSYQQFIDNYKIPGLSFAVIDDYKVIYTNFAGVKDTKSKQKIDQFTAFSTASIAKPVTATIAAMLAEQGKLDLDTPVSNYLKRWALPSSVFESSKNLSIRQLLSHTAGMSQGGYADFHLGDDIPTLIDVLEGKKLPRYKRPISMLFAPDTDWQYSGGGYVIVQVAIEDITGKPLQALAQKMLFDPLGMKNTTMYQNGDKQFLTNVAKVHDRQQQVIRDGIPICPQIAPSGLWSTPQDMAKFTIEYQKALAGKVTSVISTFVARTTTDIHTLKKIGGWSPGWMRFEAKGNLEWFSHGGSNTGTGGHIMSTMQGGKGIMVFMNATTEHRNPAIDAFIDSTIKKMKWARVISATAKPPKHQIEKMLGRYLSQFDQIVTITLSKSGNDLIYEDPLQNKKGVKMHYQGGGMFAVDNNPNQISVVMNPLSNKYFLVLNNVGSGLTERAMRKLEKDEQLPFEVAKHADFISTLKAYKAWKKNYPDSKLLSANAINNAGYNALGNKDYQVAITLFRVYSHLYPDDANAFDSLAEAYMLFGDTVNAIANYEQSLQLNPQNSNAQKMIHTLKKQ
ncbi:serine hydrolase [Pseudoalteromonas sp. S558]|uniref:serine hydrolase n=1 Tax=Pseudoalteromonas sp. S558 TaxID=2066515 RepID=UPI00110B53CD|nr:serine hydrolase [Pseudoalteromonas sp. S558]TMO02217.1 hypothetical protein CWB66_13905 [Pseudoalteromonas sp. S558]